MVHLAPAAPPDPLRHLLGGDSWLVAVARAIAGSPAWHDANSVTIVVREGEPARLGILGRFDPAMLSRLAGLSWQLRHLLPRLHYVTYEEAARLAERLAAKLADRFGLDTIRNMHFMAVPRGGHIVLGMLAYVLGLRHEQLEAPPTPDQPIVLVDDIAISGNRLKRFLAVRPGLDLAVFQT